MSRRTSELGRSVLSPPSEVFYNIPTSSDLHYTISTSGDISYTSAPSFTGLSYTDSTRYNSIFGSSEARSIGPVGPVFMNAQQSYLPPNHTLSTDTLDINFTTGEVKIKEGVALSEAAKIFWAEVQKAYGCYLNDVKKQNEEFVKEMSLELRKYDKSLYSGCAIKELVSKYSKPEAPIIKSDEPTIPSGFSASYPHVTLSDNSNLGSTLDNVQDAIRQIEAQPFPSGHIIMSETDFNFLASDNSSISEIGDMAEREVASIINSDLQRFVGSPVSEDTLSNIRDSLTHNIVQTVPPQQLDNISLTLNINGSDTL